jgi:hypothetical protein
MGQKFVLYVKNSVEKVQFTVKVFKKSSLWTISRKAPYRIFSNIPFWKVPRVPRNTPSLVFCCAPFGKLALKNHRGKIERKKMNYVILKRKVKEYTACIFFSHKILV